MADRTYRCTNNHCFDLSKEGYLNLLLSHQRKSKNPGDDKAMIQARRRFFDSGSFDPVSQAIEKQILGLKPKAQSLKPFRILDCGCGEGHFLGALSETSHTPLRLGSAGGVAPPATLERIGRGKLIGIDISKEAIRCAAKRYKDVTWIVANAMRELPLADHSMDVILSVLAPRNTEEFARVLKPEGKLILGVPGPNHLIELRTLLGAGTGDFDEKADEAVAKCAPQFTETKRESLSYQIALNKKQIADLIQMTPIFWNSAPKAKEEAHQLDELSITFSFALLTLES